MASSSSTTSSVTATSSSTTSSVSSSITGTSTSQSTFVAGISTFDPGVSTLFPSTTSTTSFSVSSTGSLSSLAPSSTMGLAGRPSSGPPYINPQALGGQATRSDLAASSLGLVLFFIGALGHLFLFKHGRNKGRTFPMAVAVTIFCFIRIITLALRMGWATNQSNAHLALAASIFVGAGTVILNIVNLVLTNRVIRSQHFSVGSSLPFRVIGRMLLVTIVLTIFLLVIAGVQASYTLNAKTRRVDRYIQLYGTTFNSVISFLPLPLLLLSTITGHRGWKYAPSTARRRALIVFMVGFLLTFRAVWICSALWQPVAPPNHPLEWYYVKPVYYVVALLPELLVVYLLALGRFDKYFYTNPEGVFDDIGSKTVSPDPSIIRFPDMPSPDQKRGWASPKASSPTFRNQASPTGNNVTQHYPPNPSVRLPSSRASPTDDLRPPRFYNGEYQRSHESLVHAATGYGSPIGSLTPKRSMELPKQSLEYPPNIDIEQYPLPTPPPQVHREMPRGSSVYSNRHTASLRHDHPSLQLISSLANGASLAEALRMSRSSILIDPNGNWTFIASDQQPTNAMVMNFSDAPPMPALPPLNFAEDTHPRHSTYTRSPLASHPVQSYRPPASRVSQQYPQIHSAGQHYPQQAQSHSNVVTQPPNFSRSYTSPLPDTQRQSSSLRSAERSSSGSSDDMRDMVAPLRPAIKRTSHSAAATLADASKQVSFNGSLGTASYSSVGLSTMIGIADGADDWWSSGIDTKRTTPS